MFSQFTFLAVLLSEVKKNLVSRCSKVEPDSNTKHLLWLYGGGADPSPYWRQNPEAVKHAAYLHLSPLISSTSS